MKMVYVSSFPERFSIHAKWSQEKTLKTTSVRSNCSNVPIPFKLIAFIWSNKSNIIASPG